MNKVFTENGWADYTFWETEDRKTLKKINKLIEDICRNGNEGIGKPEALSGNLAGYWSRRINDKDRLIYKIDENNVYILACRITEKVKKCLENRSASGYDFIKLTAFDIRRVIFQLPGEMLFGMHHRFDRIRKEGGKY